MEYTILSRETRISTTVTTLVEYVFEGETKQVYVAHFEPQSEEDIIQGVINRGITEEKYLTVAE